MTVMLETITLPEQGLFNVNVNLTANIQVTAEAARRRVSTFVGKRIADLLYGESPQLILKATGAFWRVPIILASRSLGRIGAVGAIDVDVETGELKITEQLIHEIEDHAQRLAAGAVL